MERTWYGVVKNYYVINDKLIEIEISGGVLNGSWSIHEYRRIG